MQPPTQLPTAMIKHKQNQVVKQKDQNIKLVNDAKLRSIVYDPLFYQVKTNHTEIKYIESP